MDVSGLGKKILGELLVMIFLITGCLPSDVPSNRNSASTRVGNGLDKTGNGAVQNPSDLGDGTSLPPRVEIRHLIDPNLSTDPNYSTGTGYMGGGSYVRKLTLPKNFAGKLYVAGINISTLNDRHVRVRFKFGLNKEAVTIPATVVQAPGITPQTPISVLVLDLRSEPFRNVRLPYDLFDYNEYDFTAGDTPTQDNRNTGLFCRGLNINDDPSFVGVGACNGLESNPDQPEEECLYAYAKVVDQGLIRETNGVKVPLSPTLPQVMSFSGSNYLQDYFSQQIKKTLPDTMPTSASFTAGTFAFSEASTLTGSTNITFTYPTSIWDPVTPAGQTSRFYYRGPYRIVNFSEWHFKFDFDRLHGPKRLFKENSYVDYPIYNSSPLPDDNQASPFQDRIYFNSYLFPLATQLNLSSNIPHKSSGDVIGVRSQNSLSTTGKTLWMDGSNARAQSINSEFNHIGSCNVTATMEIIATDDNGNDYVISQSKDVKLQLVRPTHYQTDIGNEVLYTNFKTCTSNAQCGGSECCFNSRCWDKSLVSQCFDDSQINGNKEVGASCTTDLQCSSLCCNRTSGQCAPHNTSLSPTPVSCSKPIGEFCIAKEWCQKSPIVKRLIVQQGTDSQGNQLCTAYHYTVMEYGDCKNSVCVPPEQETFSSFDPTAPGACNNAVPAPRF